MRFVRGACNDIGSDINSIAVAYRKAQRYHFLPNHAGGFRPCISISLPCPWRPLAIKNPPKRVDPVKL
jgi:hypothetical protein